MTFHACQTVAQAGVEFGFSELGRPSMVISEVSQHCLQDLIDGLSDADRSRSRISYEAVSYSRDPSARALSVLIESEPKL
jgi:hypothetical protein